MYRIPRVDMDSKNEQASEQGMSITIDIPAAQPALFKHAATDDILHVLANRRFHDFTIRELAERTEYAKGSISNAIDVLVGNELITVDYEGPAKRISINTARLDVPADPITRIPQAEYHAPVRAAVDELTMEIDNVAGIVLYGSVARGEADRQSDIDLWVLVTDNRMDAQRTVNELMTSIEDRRFNDPGERYDFHVDVEQPEAIGQYADDINRILSDGILLYSTDTFEKAETIIQQMAEGVNDE